MKKAIMDILVVITLAVLIKSGLDHFVFNRIVDPVSKNITIGAFMVIMIFTAAWLKSRVKV
jgi:hypothetical protein